MEEEKFNWSKYNKSQTQEKTLFLNLLKELCSILPEKYMISRRGQPMRLSKAIFCLCMKAYCLKSSRRILGELELCRKAGFIDKQVHFNTLLNYLRNTNITLLLQDLIKLTSLPLQSIEKKFAQDSSGWSNAVLHDRWSVIRKQYSKHHKYFKAHITYGVLTNIVTSCRITAANVADSPMLAEMVDETAENFKMEEFSADKAYSSRKNLEKIWEKGCLPFIPFRSDTNTKNLGLGVWREMYNFFEKNHELFMKKYHLRSNAEAGFHMIKSRFGDLTQIRNETGAKNDILVKVLCHNLCVLCQEIFLLGIDFNFAQFKDKLAQSYI